MKILITGAAGVVGRIIAKALGYTHDLVLVDICEPVETRDYDFWSLAKSHVFSTIDISNKSRIQNLINDSKPDAVIHLAAVLGRQTRWDKILSTNVVGSVDVLEASLASHVNRVIYGSSNNVYGGYEKDAFENGNPLHTQVTPPLLNESMTPRPDSRYAVAKLMIENYATFLAKNSGLRTFGLRIGTVRDIDNPEDQLDEKDLIPRFRKTWLYHQDLVQLIHLCLSTKRETGIYNAISAYPGEHGVFIDITKAMKELGYAPKGNPANK